MRKYTFILLACGIPFLIACKTTRYIDRETIKVDSSVIEENNILKMQIRATVEGYEKRIEQIGKTGIVFDTVYRDTGRVINKVTFDNGKIKTVEGRILSISQDLNEKKIDLMEAYSLIDSLSLENEKKTAELSKEVKTVTKEIVKRGLPFWFWILLALGLVGGWFIRQYWLTWRIKVRQWLT